MLYDDKYSYFLSDDFTFNSNYLMSKDKYDKYILVFYNDGERVLSKKIRSNADLKDINNIVVKYYIESINITDVPFESEFSYSEMLFVRGIGYYKRVIFLDDLEYSKQDNELIRKKICSYDKNWQSLDINELKFFDD